MKAEEHVACAQQWDRAAQLAEQAGLELVVPHARFYEAAHYIEAILASKRIHSDDHLIRIRNMYESSLFSFDEVQFFEKVTRQRLIVEFQMPSRSLRELVESGPIFRRRWERGRGGPAAPGNGGPAPDAGKGTEPA